MTKAEFIGRLRERLEPMPAEERERELAYYEELFADMAEDGLSEEEIAGQLGDPDEIAGELLAELPMGELVKSRVQARGGWTALNILLLVLGAPLWLPLLLAAAAVLLALLISAWAVGLSVGVVLPAVGLSGVALGIAALVDWGALPLLLALGCLLIGAGVLILGVLLMGLIVRALAGLCRSIWRGCKRALAK